MYIPDISFWLQYNPKLAIYYIFFSSKSIDILINMLIPIISISVCFIQEFASKLAKYT